MRSLPIVFMLTACGSEPIGLKDQSFTELETWGLGIEDFNPNVNTPVDTGPDNTGFTQYDGAYFGTSQLAVSFGGDNCSVSDVSLILKGFVVAV